TGWVIEVTGESFALRALAGVARTTTRRSGSARLDESDAFAALRANLSIASGFEMEGGLRIDRLGVQSSGLAVDGQLTLWDPGADLGVRWRHGVGAACWVDLGVMAAARAHREVVSVEGIGDLLTVPAVWISPEALAGCRVF